MSRPQVIALVFITFVIVVGGTFLLIGLLQTDDSDTLPPLPAPTSLSQGR